MRMVLEIINSCLTNNLHHNSNLIYSLLYNKNSYLLFRDHPNFQDVIQNIDTVRLFDSIIIYFNRKDFKLFAFI